MFTGQPVLSEDWLRSPLKLTCARMEGPQAGLGCLRGQTLGRVRSWEARGGVRILPSVPLSRVLHAPQGTLGTVSYRLLLLYLVTKVYPDWPAVYSLVNLLSLPSIFLPGEGKGNRQSQSITPGWVQTHALSYIRCSVPIIPILQTCKLRLGKVPAKSPPWLVGQSKDLEVRQANPKPRLLSTPLTASLLPVPFLKMLMSICQSPGGEILFSVIPKHIRQWKLFSFLFFFLVQSAL